jgi:hypothetical protein
MKTEYSLGLIQKFSRLFFANFSMGTWILIGRKFSQKLYIERLLKAIIISRIRDQVKDSKESLKAGDQGQKQNK